MENVNVQLLDMDTKIPEQLIKIGFNRAARIMNQLEETGVVGEELGTAPRKILMSMEEFEKLTEENI